MVEKYEENRLYHHPDDGGSLYDAFGIYLCGYFLRVIKFLL